MMETDGEWGHHDEEEENLQKDGAISAQPSQHFRPAALPAAAGRAWATGEYDLRRQGFHDRIFLVAYVAMDTLEEGSSVWWIVEPNGDSTLGEG